MLNAHSAPSPAGDLHDPVARAWWHLQVPSMHWHPQALERTGNAAMLPALIGEQAWLVDLLNAATGELPGTATLEQRIAVCQTVLASWNEDLLQSSTRAMAGEPTRYTPFMKLANTNRVPLAQMFMATTPKALAAAFDLIGQHPPLTEGLAARPPNLHLLNNRLVQTFGLSGLAVDLSLLPVAQQVDRLDRLETALHDACRRLGIAPEAWGAMAPVLTMTGPASTLMDDLSNGEFRGVHHAITVHQPIAHDDHERLTQTLMHEWTHALDHGVLARHEVPGVDPDEAASRFLARTTVAERQAMNLPPVLQRSLALVARIVDEMKGDQPPMLETGRLNRRLAQGMGKLWNRAAQGADTVQDQAYFATDTEMLARMVQHRDTPTQHRSVASMMGTSRNLNLGRWLNLGNGVDMAGRRPAGTLALFDELVRHEGLAAGPRPAGSPAITPTLGNRGKALRPS